MPLRRRLLVSAVLALVLLVAAVAALVLVQRHRSAPLDVAALPRPTTPSTLSVPRTAAPLPGFTAPTLGGGTFELASHRGRVVVLNVWATWCAPCREETPALVRVQRDLGPRGLQVAGIAIDEEGAAAVAPFVAEYGVPYPIVLDPAAELAARWDAHWSVPTTLVLDRRGVLRHRFMTAVDEGLLREVLEPMLAEADDVQADAIR